MKLSLIAVLLALPVAALAQQQPPLQQQLDTASATVTRVVTGLTNALASDAQQIDAMRQQMQQVQQQLQAVTKERDALKEAAAKAAAPTPDQAK